RRQKRNPMPLGDGAGGHRNPRLVGADEGNNLLLGDETQRLVLARRGRALIVSEDDLDLGPAEPRQTFAVGQRHVLKIGIAMVDEIDGKLDGGLRETAGACRIAAQRIDGANPDRLLPQPVLRGAQGKQRRTESRPHTSLQEEHSTSSSSRCGQQLQPTFNWFERVASLTRAGTMTHEKLAGPRHDGKAWATPARARGFFPAGQSPADLLD